MVQSIRMTLDQWYKVEDNPIQRDTERHAAKAKHLKTFHPTHAVVHAAELPNKKLIKLDGHTRALMWRRGDAPCPPFQLICCIYPVKDKAEAEQLYKDFDSNAAVETKRDKISGAFKRHNFEPQSPLLQGGGLTYALKIAWSILKGFAPTAAQTAINASRSREETKAILSADVYAMIDEFSYELHALDAFNVGKAAATSGVIAAFLISYRKYGHKITPFWTGVFGNKGSKIDGQMDAIQAISEWLMGQKGKSGTQSSAANTCSRALNAVEGFLAEKMYVRSPTPLDTTGYMLDAQAPAERLIKAADIGRKKTA